MVVIKRTYHDGVCIGYNRVGFSAFHSFFIFIFLLKLVGLTDLSLGEKKKKKKLFGPAHNVKFSTTVTTQLHSYGEVLIRIYISISYSHAI